MSWETGPHVGALYGSTPTQTAAPWIENLEAYSCLQEIQTTCKSLGIVMAITNQIGPQSRLQWKAHMHQAALTTAHYLVNRVK
jgi:hypothetical protein